MPSKVIIIVTEFMFLGINIFWDLLRAHFNPRLTDRGKMSLSRAQNIFMPANINSIVLLVPLIVYFEQITRQKFIAFLELFWCIYSSTIVSLYGQNIFVFAHSLLLANYKALSV